MTATPETDTLVRVGSIEGPGYYQHGPHSGQPAHLVQLAMCNLSCEWCPTPELVAGLGGILDTTAPLVTVEHLAEQVASQWSLDPQAPVLIAGGEPLLQDYAILDLTQRLQYIATIHVETNGTKPPPDWWTDWVHHTVVRPRVGTRDAMHKRINDRALLPWVELHAEGLAAFAFTVATRSDVLHAARVCTWLGLSPADVWLHPAGNTLAAQFIATRKVHDAAAEHGFRLTPLIAPMLEGDPR